MMETQASDMRVIRLDDLPILFALLKELTLATQVDRLVPTNPQWTATISPGEVVVGWLVYILSQNDHRLNQVEAWVGLHLTVYRTALNKPVRALDFSDDRLAWVLDTLSQSSLWNALERQLNEQTIRVYNLKVDRIRLDPTTASSNVSVSSEGLLQRGHSKDQRPQDGQLKVQLAMLDPLAMPLVTQVVSGNSADDPLYLPAIQAVQQSLGAGGKTYIGDSKMSSRQTRAALVRTGDYYLTPLGPKQLPPQERGELIARALCREIPLQMIYRQSQQAGETTESSPELIADGYESIRHVSVGDEQESLAWEERLLVVRSIAYADAERVRLEQRLTRAETELSALLVRKQGKPRRTAEQIAQAVSQIITKHRLDGLLEVELRISTREFSVRPYNGSAARQRIEHDVQLQITRQTAAIAAANEQMGWHIYATNHPNLTLEEAVVAYREQYRIEHGIGRLKGRPLGLVPMYLSKPERMVGLIHLLTIGLRLLTLLEFRVRQALDNDRSPLRGIYAGQNSRATLRPSAELLLQAFIGISAVVYLNNDQIVAHISPLSPTQLRILNLLGLDAQLYSSFIRESQNLVPP